MGIVIQADENNEFPSFDKVMILSRFTTTNAGLRVIQRLCKELIYHEKDNALVMDKVKRILDNVEGIANNQTELLEEVTECITGT